jgi:FkbM family methyltransferase
MLEEMKSAIKMVRALYRAINRIRGFRLNEPALRRQVSVIGSDYGAWGVDLSLLHPNSIVYSIGVGEDITFDTGLIEAVGCNLYAFDPTPIAVEWIARQSIPKEFHFHPIGLSSLDGEAEFQVPPQMGWHSFSLSAEPGAEQTGSARLPVRRLSTLMNQFGHDHLDLIKLDIEGFEYAALDDMIATSVRPTMLLVEFHHGSYAIRAEKTRCAVSRLIEYEYGIFWVSDVGREYGFLDLHALRMRLLNASRSASDMID